MSNSPIFIIGTERSGTNLLRLILNAHNNITVPHPPHIMRNFSPIAGKFKSFEKLIDAVLKTIHYHPHPWEHIPSREQVLDTIKGKDLISIFLAIYVHHLSFSGKKRWCCKSTFMVNHVEEVIRYSPEARFIFMVRDPRDVCVSAKKSIFNNFHPWYIAQRWKAEQIQGLTWLEKLGPKQVHLFQYEKLLDQPEGAIKNLCEFLDEDFDRDMMNFFKTKEASVISHISQSWENSNRPIIRNNKNKFLKSLDSSEIKIIESICKKEMIYMGYTPLHEGRFLGDYSNFDFNYLVLEKIGMLKIQTRAFFKDKNNIKRYLKFWYLQFSWMFK